MLEMKGILLYSIFIVLFFQVIKGNEHEKNKYESTDDNDNTVYRRYVEEISNIISTDENFMDKIRRLFQENATMSDEELFHNYSMRSVLDEAKRRAIKTIINSHKNMKNMKINFTRDFDFIDLRTKHFGASDFKKMATAAAHRIEEIDDTKRNVYKQHVEREKRKEALKYAQSTKEDRKRMLKQYLEREKNHSLHAKVNQPGSKDQMHEYWKVKEGLDESDFDPKVLYKFLDLNDDDVLGIEELEGLLQYEINKIYNASDSDFDPFEADYDLQMMRSQLMDFYDTDGDMLISYDEFVRGLSSPKAQLHSVWRSAQDDEDAWQNEESLEELVKKYNISNASPEHNVTSLPVG